MRLSDMHRHLVLLGASNLTRSFPYVVSLASQGFDESLSVFAAKGFGRSYGREAGCLGKKFPGIFCSGIWSALDCAKAAPISAVITDIGNDLGYEVPVSELLEWVTGCVERLQRLDAEVVVTDIPVESIGRVSETRFRLFRTLLFPSCSLGRQELVRRTETLRAGLYRLAESQNISVFPVQNHWYGFDPIHPHRRHLHEMWRELTCNFDGFRLPKSEKSCSLLTSAYLRLLNAETWTHFFFQRTATQPQGQLVDGSRIFLY